MPHSTLSKSVVALAAGYGLGNIPSADLANRAARRLSARRRGVTSPVSGDLRLVGSRNPGALNAGRELGKSWGATVFAADVAKGFGAAAIGRRLGGPNAANLASAAAVAGHCYPAFGRSGGKGVATSIGQVIGTFPRYLPLDIGVAMVTATLPRWTQRTWAATAVASSAWVTSATIAWRRAWPTGTDDPAPIGLPIAAMLSSALIARRFTTTPLVDGEPIPDDGDQAS